MKNRIIQGAIDIILRLILVFVVIICVIGIASGGSNQSKMDARADFVARCRSVGGEIGGTKCYVNGSEAFSE